MGAVELEGVSTIADIAVRGPAAWERAILGEMPTAFWGRRRVLRLAWSMLLIGHDVQTNCGNQQVVGAW